MSRRAIGEDRCMRTRLGVLLAVVSGLFSVLLAVAVNVATGGTLPAPLDAVSWLAWPAVGVLGVAGAGLAFWQQSTPQPALPPGPPPAQDPPPQPAPAELPAATPLFGRDDEVAEIVRVLGGGSAVVTLAAAPGTGKTSLALGAAHALRSRFPDGQLFATLRGASTEPVAPEAVLGRFLTALGVPEEERRGSTEELAARFRSAVADRARAGPARRRPRRRARRRAAAGRVPVRDDRHEPAAADRRRQCAWCTPRRAPGGGGRRAPRTRRRCADRPPRPGRRAGARSPPAPGCRSRSSSSPAGSGPVHSGHRRRWRNGSPVSTAASTSCGRAIWRSARRSRPRTPSCPKWTVWCSGGPDRTRQAVHPRCRGRPRGCRRAAGGGGAGAARRRVPGRVTRPGPLPPARPAPAVRHRDVARRRARRRL